MKPYTINGFELFPWKRDRERGITLDDLQDQYKHFCDYAKEGRYKGSIYKGWGLLAKTRYEYKQLGFRKFE